MIIMKQEGIRSGSRKMNFLCNEILLIVGKF